MSIADEVESVLLEAESDFPATVTIAGTDYSALVSSASASRNLGVGGFAMEHDLTVLVRQALFTTAPSAQQTLVFNSQSYSVDRVVSAPGDSHYRLYCVSISRGA